MITQAEYLEAQQRASGLFQSAGIALRSDELAHIEVADFGLGEVTETGLQILTLLETEDLGVKLLALLPSQTCAQHRHPPLGDYVGKEETFRTQLGELYLYLPGDPTPDPKARPPAHRAHTYTVWHEIVLRPGDQVTCAPDTPHWFQAGPDGAVVWSFSSRPTDVQDVFTDPDVKRRTVIRE